MIYNFLCARYHDIIFCVHGTPNQYEEIFFYINTPKKSLFTRKKCTFFNISPDFKACLAMLPYLS